MRADYISFDSPVTGFNLRSLADESLALKRRFVFPALEGYLSESPHGKVCILYGLRRTGKTTMMFQGMDGRFDKSAYILCSKDMFMGKLLADIYDLVNKQGIRHVFIDEVTDMIDFAENANFLSDYIAKSKIHVILAGTDSLGFMVAQSKLYDREKTIHTTWTPYAEHSELLSSSIHDYIRSGGIFAENRLQSFRNYPMEAIVHNILNTINKYDGKRSFGGLDILETEDLETAIQQVIRDDGHRFINKVIRSDFSVGGLPKNPNSHQNERIREIIRRIDANVIAKRVMQRLNVSPKEKAKSLSAPQRTALMRYMAQLDLIYPHIRVNYDELDKSKAYAVFDKFRALKDDKYKLEPNMHDGYWALFQPGLRWAQAKVFSDEIREYFMDESWAMLPEIPFMDDGYESAVNLICESLEKKIEGHILEETVYCEICKSFPENRTFFFGSPHGEIDIVSVSGKHTHMFEIKSDKDTESWHGKNMRKAENQDALKEFFCRPLTRNVIYTGEDSIDRHGCHYLNAEKFLIDAHNGKLNHGEIISEDFRERKKDRLAEKSPNPAPRL